MPAPPADRPVVTRSPVRARRGDRLVGLDRHWLRSTGFTLLLVGLVAAAIGADWTATVSALLTCAVGFGFFYLLFSGGAHFGITVANFLAIYVCIFEFFRDANFPAAPQPFAPGAVALPVVGFLGGCVVRRRQVFPIIHARRIRELEHLPRITSWLVGALAVGAASFALPRLELPPVQQGLALLGAMALFTLFVITSVRDVILVMIDIAMVFEGVAVRLDQLVRPLMAFVTCWWWCSPASIASLISPRTCHSSRCTASRRASASSIRYITALPRSRRWGLAISRRRRSWHARSPRSRCCQAS